MLDNAPSPISSSKQGRWLDRIDNRILPLQTFSADTQASSPERKTPLAAYQAALRNNLIQDNPSQLKAVEALELLYHELVKQSQYRQDLAQWQARSRLGRLLHKKPRNNQSYNSIKGLYMHGSVGIGKTMMMDFIARSLEPQLVVRAHFHAFMFAVHERLHVLRSQEQSQDPVKDLVNEFAAQKMLLCLDEFIVNNIADAMLMARLFASLFEQGVALVTTSNTAPQDLYKDGLHRQRFIPFIKLLQESVWVQEIEAPQDYRRGLRILPTLYMTPLNRNTETKMHDSFRALAADIANAELVEQNPCELKVHGRTLHAVASKGSLIFFRFSQLCSAALAAQDYQWLCENFSTFLIADIPQLSDDRRSEIRRFITLIDVLYDHHKLCIFSAASAIEQIYPYGQDHQDFQRCISRIKQMQSQDYVTQIDPRFQLQG